MNKNPITITIENYKGKKITFTAPENATVDIIKSLSVKLNNYGTLTKLHIDMISPEGIKEQEEDIN